MAPGAPDVVAEQERHRSKQHAEERRHGAGGDIAIAERLEDARRREDLQRAMQLRYVLVVAAACDLAGDQRVQPLVIGECADSELPESQHRRQHNDRRYGDERQQSGRVALEPGQLAEVDVAYSHSALPASGFPSSIGRGCRQARRQIPESAPKSTSPGYQALHWH